MGKGKYMASLLQSCGVCPMYPRCVLDPELGIVYGVSRLSSVLYGLPCRMDVVSLWYSSLLLVDYVIAACCVIHAVFDTFTILPLLIDARVLVAQDSVLINRILTNFYLCELLSENKFSFRRFISRVTHGHGIWCISGW